MTSAPSTLEQSMAIAEPKRWRTLLLLSLAELLRHVALVQRFRGCPALTKEWRLTESEVSWISIAVQLGFVAGTLISAVLNLSDIISARHLCCYCWSAGAVTNAASVLYSPT